MNTQPFEYLFTPFERGGRRALRGGGILQAVKSPRHAKSAWRPPFSKGVNRYKNILLLFSLFCIYLIAWINQSAFLLNSDNSWCLHAAKRLLAHGTYVNDFFDVNLPFTLYLYAPPHFLVKFFSTTIIFAFKFYVFLLASISLCACYFLTRKIFSKENSLLAGFFICTIAFILLILPQYFIGEREHLFLIFTLPYFLFVSLRLRGYTVNSIYTILISLGGGMGFVIKPYFLVTFGLIELYYIWHTRRLLNICRIETLVIFLFILGYIIFIFRFHPQFVYTMIPYLTKYFYSKGFDVEAWRTIIFNGPIFYCFFTLIFFLLQYQENAYKELGSILWLSLIGSLCFYLIQRNTWHYHYLPALSIASLLNVLLFGLFLKKISKNLYEWLFTSLLALFLFYAPFNFVKYNYHQGVMFKSLLQHLIAFMNYHTKNKTVYFLTTNLYNTLPSIDYSNTILASRFAHIPVLPGILQTLRSSKKPYSKNLIEDENFLMHLVVDDIVLKKPDFIFIDGMQHKKFADLGFDYISYFSKNVDFRETFKKDYRYLTTVEQSDIITKKFKILFYLFEDIHSIDTVKHDNLFANKIVLIGKDHHRTAYLLHGTETVREVGVTLTDAEYLFFEKQNQGLIEKTIENQSTLESLEDKITHAAYPFYKLVVYKKIT